MMKNVLNTRVNEELDVRLPSLYFVLNLGVFSPVAKSRDEVDDEVNDEVNDEENDEVDDEA